MHKDEEQKWAGPGDTGPCPKCGEDMGAKSYWEMYLGGETREFRGRYWHMINEHGIYEDYNLGHHHD